MAAQRKKLAVASPPSAGDLRAQLVKRGMIAPLLSVVVPVKNEEEAILGFVKRVGAVLDGIATDEGWEILFVDDGS
ncbi:MAG: glycosyltransferase, partial [Sphingomicrobium sp.]